LKYSLWQFCAFDEVVGEAELELRQNVGHGRDVAANVGSVVHMAELFLKKNQNNVIVSDSISNVDLLLGRFIERKKYCRSFDHFLILVFSNRL
jgi:hypothetical protein